MQISQSPTLNPKRFWSYIKSNRQEQISIPELKSEDGDVITDNKEKANLINRHFESVFVEESNSPLPYFPKKCGYDMAAIDITPEGIFKQLKNLNVKKSQGSDLIPAIFLNQCSSELALPLTYIFQKSLDTGDLANDWLDAIVHPVHKKGRRDDPSNYRPISLTSICCKILEHVICSNIHKHLEFYRLLSLYQHVSQKTHTALCSVH
jgi:hypothetical protein